MSKEGEGVEKRLVQAGQQAVAWLAAHPDSIWAARGAAAMLRAVREHAHHLAAAQRLLSPSSLEALLPAVAPGLASPSQSLRCALLAVLTAFDQPHLTPTGDNSTAGAQAGGDAKVPRFMMGCLLV
ncbi:uncharacterized protein HaLaN_11597 [Haematococcus lacustris]|uniref:Uncharacterized protein n=1 Tax=Haematococcus lacustris TaxID=44745 RepID=A0A699Z8D6_HAELA|nr:uncharacterized protein HaLaN_11597 [Haematococcus lacustris]